MNDYKSNIRVSIILPNKTYRDLKFRASLINTPISTYCSEAILTRLNTNHLPLNEQLDDIRNQLNMIRSSIDKLLPKEPA